MDIVFAVVPFADVARPAIGVSLLKAELRQRGFSARVEYLNIDFAATIGEPVYTHMCHDAPSDSMAGEWFFSDLLFPNQLPPAHEYAVKILGPMTEPAMMKEIDRARAHRRTFLERSTRRILENRPKIVGFTTTFHQTCACLAIAKLLKQSPNPPVIVFGGANCEGVMGLQLLQSFPWIDYVCTREGDHVFPDFVDQLLRHGDASPLPGFLKQGVSTEPNYPEIVESLDDLPIPEYEDYFEQLSASSIAGSVKPSLQIESSRGCWWGAKHHCTFCGLNGQTMGFRGKSPQRVFDEMLFLSNRYSVKRIESVDNILDLRYTTQVFPRLKAVGAGLELFYEVKANLKFEQLRAMRDGGVRAIQPGIESLSDEVLSLMRKGITGLQNVQLLKWSEELNITPSWNVLAGFPGESPAEYEKTAAMIPLLTHLEAPTGCSPIRLDRFSPLFDNAEEMGLRRVRPTLAYYYVFPLARRELAKLAYFFDFDYADGRHPNNYLTSTREEVEKWRAARFSSAPPRLDVTITDSGRVRIQDTRPAATAPEHMLEGLPAKLYLACDSVQATPALRRGFEPQHSAAAIDDAISGLIKQRLIVENNHHLLALGVLRNRPMPLTTHNGVMAHANRSAAADSQPLLRVL
jgi:ribosomal peptide maturation radical SAM protein 1